MDAYDDQMFSPTSFFSSEYPESITSLMDPFLQGPILVETETVNEDHAGLIANPAITEADPSMNTQHSDLAPLPETLTVQQNPPQLQHQQQQQQLLSNSSEFLQGNLPNILSNQLNQNVNYVFEANVSTLQQQQRQQQLLSELSGILQGNLPNIQSDPSNKNMNYVFESNVSTMQQQQQQLLSHSNGFVQGNLPNIQANQNMNVFESNVSTMQQQELLSNPHGYSQENLPNRQLNQNMLNSFQQPDASTMIETGQQVEGANNGYPPSTMINSFELPNHLQEQCLSVPLSRSYPSYPRYQGDPFASSFNMYGQQPPPAVLGDRVNEPIVPTMATHFARTYPQGPQQNQISMTPPLRQRLPSSTRTYPQQNQASMSPPLRQILPSSSRRLVRRPPVPSCRYPPLETYSPIPPSTSAFTTSLQPTYQQGPFASSLSMYDRQMSPLSLADGRNEPLVPSMVTNLARTYPPHNQISMTRPPSPLRQILPSSTRTYPLSNQISMTRPLPSMPSRSTRPSGNMQELVNQPPSTRYSQLNTGTQMSPPTNSTTPLQSSLRRGQPSIQNRSERGESSSSATKRRLVLPERNVGSVAENRVQERNPLQNQISMAPPLPQTLSSSTRHQGNIQELVNQPSSSRHPQLNNDTQMRPTTNPITPLQSSLGPRQRSDQSRFEHGESSSSQRRRIVLPERNVQPAAGNPVQHRIENRVYSWRYESVGLHPDPHLRIHFNQE